MQSLHVDGSKVADGPLHKHKHMHTAKRARGRFTYYLQDPRQGSKKLAIKNHFIAMIGEFVGTTLFMFFALGGTNVANIPSTSVTGATQAGQADSTAAVANTSNLLYIALCFGFSLAVNAWIFFRVSGGLFNPAVSWGMMLVGAITPLRAALLTVSQILGGIVGSALIQALLPGTLNVRTTLSPGMSVVRGLFLEMLLSAMLMLAILLLAAEKSKATFLAPIGIGLALFIAELLGVFYTGGSLNPARSFGPSVVLTDFESYHWIYWVGPLLGATLSAGFYKFIKWLEFETVLGPDNDDDGPKRTLPALSAPAQNLLDQNKAPSVMEVEKTGLAADVPATAGLTDIVVQGPGLADALTAGDATQVYGLPEAPIDYGLRLERIEALLEALAGNQLSIQKSAASGSTVVEMPQDTMGDARTDRDGHKWSLDYDKTVVGDENV